VLKEKNFKDYLVMIIHENVKEQKMNYEKPTITTYSEEEVIAIIGPAISGSIGGYGSYEELEDNL
jgi:hypothetical protein